MKSYDLVFVGHMLIDEIHPFKGEKTIVPGSAVLCGAMAARKAGKEVLVVTRLAKKDFGILDEMRKAGIVCHCIPSKETTRNILVHPTANLEDRKMTLVKSAGPFEIGDFPDVMAKQVHLAGVTDQEFTLEFIRELKHRGYSISTDMQCFVRQVNPATKEIKFKDVPKKKLIASFMDKIKLDITEAKILTGTDNLEKAARIVSSWDCKEVMITHSEGVLLRAGGKTYYERFTNRNSIGRTGRGDTTFGAYLARRLTHNPADSLKFAAVLVSIKMETSPPGPFRGTIKDVLSRMRTQKKIAIARPQPRKSRLTNPKRFLGPKPK